MIDIRSLWLATSDAPARPPLAGEIEADVCVIGGGIVGVTAALLLAEEGRSVALLEAERLGSGVTGYTTAKVSAVHGTAYSELRSKHGTDGIRAYAMANTAGLEQIARWVSERGIDCDFARRANYTYTSDPDSVSDIEKEAEALRDAGLAAEVVTDSDLPYGIEAAVRLTEQAQFHPRKYVLALAEALEAAGGRIFESTRATGVHEGEPCEVKCDGGFVRARHVIVATHYPFLDRGLYFARVSPQRSYAIGVRVNGTLPEGMYISVEQPTRSIRAHGDVLIVGGEGHKTGEGGDTTEKYENLERWAREHWDVQSVDYRWASQDNVTADGMPYVGHYRPGSQHLWVATGFRKWGLANGTASAMALADAIAGRENAWLPTYDPGRAKPLAAGPKLVKENVKVAGHFFGDRLRGPDVPSLEELPAGEGGLVIVDGEKVGAYRHEDGTVDAVHPVCTHMGCHLLFNRAEATWDCPCHGSRFDSRGGVVQGPAVKDLETREVGQPTGS